MDSFSPNLAKSHDPRISEELQTRNTPAFVLIASLFFLWGFLTCLNDILIPHLKGLFDLTYFHAMLVQFCFFFAYFVGSIPFGKLVHRIGYKTGMQAGLCLAGFGALLFYPAAGAQSFPVFLFAFFVLALGITLLQVAANPYVTALGPRAKAVSRLNLVQAFNSLGTTLAPLVGSALIYRDALQVSQASVVQGPYLAFALSLFGVALILFFSNIPQIKDSSLAKDSPGASERSSVWKYRHLVLGAVAIFTYVGGEVSIGSFLISFLSDPHILGMSRVTAGKCLAIYWGGAMVGRFLGSWVLSRVKPVQVLAFNASAAGGLVCLAILSKGNVAMVSILGVGFFNSIMFPTIFSLAIRELGRFTGMGSGILCTAIVGGAVVPVLQGLLADRTNVQFAFAIPLLCYLYILFYALRGSRIITVNRVTVK